MTCGIYIKVPLSSRNNITLLHSNSTVFNLLSICHKYHFELYEKWASQLLLKHCANIEGKNRYLDIQPFSELKNMPRISVRINLYQLTEAIERSFLRKLQERPSLSVARALNLAEELDLCKFQGRLYYHEYTRESTVRLKSSSAYAFPPGDLTPAQTLAFFVVHSSYPSTGRTSCPWSST